MTPNPASALCVSGAEKHFGAVAAIDGLDLEVAGGEIVVLVGPSGCGKTTLLRTIAGLEHLDAGSMVLGGVEVDDGRHQVAPERRRVGLVFQEHALFPHLSVADNVGFGRDGAGKAPSAERVAELLRIVGLGDLGHRFPHELSGGQRQRVALARALAPQPVLVLLDEPFASLDAGLRHQLRCEVVEALKSTGTPAVMVTHDHEEALAVGDRIGVMRDGRLLQLGSPAELYRRPATPFVASFLGEASFLSVTDGACALGPVTDAARAVSGQGVRPGSAAVSPERAAASTIAAPKAETSEATPAGGVAARSDGTAVLRPHEVTFETAEDGDATIIGLEFRGAWWRCEVALGDDRLVCRVDGRAEVAIGHRGRVALAPGARPHVIFDE